MSDKPTTMKDVKDFFSKDTERAVTTSEFSEFWKSCSDEDKAAFKEAVAAL